MKLQFNLFVIDTFARLQGVEILLRALVRDMPTLRARALEELKNKAEEEHWEYGDFVAEESVLAVHFDTWVETFAAYSIVVMLHSIVETRLAGFADHVGRSRRSRIALKDIAGKGIDQSARYIDLVLSIDVKNDRNWGAIKDLQLVRNFIVHSNGRLESSSKAPEIESFVQRQQKKWAEVRQVDGFGYSSQLWISLDLCSKFVKSAEDFFRQVFARANMAPHSFVPVHTDTGDADLPRK